MDSCENIIWNKGKVFWNYIKICVTIYSCINRKELNMLAVCCYWLRRKMLLLTMNSHPESRIKQRQVLWCTYFSAFRINCFVGSYCSFPPRQEIAPGLCFSAPIPFQVQKISPRFPLLGPPGFRMFLFSFHSWV